MCKCVFCVLFIKTLILQEKTTNCIIDRLDIRVFRRRWWGFEYISLGPVRLTTKEEYRNVTYNDNNSSSNTHAMTWHIFELYLNENRNKEHPKGASKHLRIQNISRQHEAVRNKLCEKSWAYCTFTKGCTRRVVIYQRLYKKSGHLPKVVQEEWSFTKGWTRRVVNYQRLYKKSGHLPKVVQ